MRKLLLALLLISCTTDSDWPINKKEVSSSQACTSPPYYIDVSPKPDRWEAYQSKSNGESLVTTPVSLQWVEGKGFYIDCKGADSLTTWTVYY